MPRYALRTLGTLGVSELLNDGDAPVILGAGKPSALLAYLALAANRAALRDECAELLWSNMERERSRLSLRQALWQLRTALGSDSVESDGQRLVLRADVSVDLLDFRAAGEAQRPEALALFAGRFMESVSFPGGAAFEQWADLERARADALLLHAAEAIVQTALRDGRLDDALRAARRTRDLLARSQMAWRLLLETCLAVGDRPLALVESEVVARWLDDDDESPEPELAATLKRLQRARDIASSSRDQHETEFVGREVEFSALLRAFHSVVGAKSRHVHVSGAAGFGKSRLLSEIAERYRALRARVATIAAVPSDRGLPFSVLARVAETVGGLPGAASLSPESAAVLVRLAPALSSTFNTSLVAPRLDDALTRTQAVREVIESVAGERHLVVLVDDLHWSDGESVEALARVADRLPANVLLVTASRPPVAMHATTTAETLTLAALDEEQVRALLAALGFEGSNDDARRLPAALRRASGGSPLMVLQLVRQGLDERWLLREEGRLSAAPDVDLERALESADPIGRRIAHLTDHEREVLQLVALAGFPVDEALLSDAVGHGMEAQLHALASRGLLTAWHGGWNCAHDVIGERALALWSTDGRRAASASIGHALARRASNARESMVAARFLVEAGETDAVRALLIRELERNQSMRRHVAPSEVAKAIVGVVMDDRQVHALLHSLPLRYRFSRRLRGASAVAAVAAVVVSAAMLRSERLVLEIAEAPAGSVQALDHRRRLELRPPLVVEERGRDGALRGGVADTIDVVVWDDSLRWADTTSLPMSEGRATFDAVRARVQPLKGLAVVRRRGARDSLLVRIAWNDSLPLRLKLVSWVTNAGTVTPQKVTLRVPPNAKVEGVVRIEYTSSYVDATLVYAATPTWGDPSQAGQTIGMLSAPTAQRLRADPLSFQAPAAPGEYFFILIAGAETEAQYLLSRTNWVLGKPVWGDGNDVAQWPRDVLLRLMRGELARAKTLYSDKGVPKYVEVVVSAIVVRVVVDPAATGPTVE